MPKLGLVGVDGCQAGWVVAASEVVASAPPTLAAPTFSIEPTFGATIDALEGTRTLIAIDIPIGLPSGAPRDTGRRRADAETRRFLGAPRSASVFSAPCRPTLAAASYREACDAEIVARGAMRGLSQQAYQIVPKIREVDAVLIPEHQEPLPDGLGVRVREVHPEAVFAALAGGGAPGCGLVHAKRGCAACRGTICPGPSERLALLRPYLPDFDPMAVRYSLLASHRRSASLRGPMVGRDDIVDAVACLVAALRVVTGRALTLPAGEPERDARGLRMEILA